MITLADLPGEVIKLLEPVLDHPKLLMAAIMILLTLVGTAMDLTPTILILAPVLAPLVAKAGIDQIYFGVMFVMVGAVPNTDWLADVVRLDEKGFVLTGDAVAAASPYETSCPGVFAVGDVRAGSVKRVASSVGEGSVVISRVWEHVNARKG